MKRSASRYPSAKFAALTDSENLAITKRNYFTWIISVTVIFGVTVGFLCYKLFIGPSYFSDALESDSSTTRISTNPIPKLLYPEITLQKEVSKDRSEFPCEQTQFHLEAIPLVFRKKILQQPYSEDVYHFISKDLLAHFERTINDHDSKYLKSFFNGCRLKLSRVRNSADFLEFLRGLASNKFKFYTGHLKKQKFQLKLQAFDWVFALTEELNHWYNYLDRLGSFLSDYEQQKRRKSFGNVTEVNFATFTEETQKNLLHFAYPFSVTEKKVVEINEIINEWTEPVQVYLNNCSLTLFNTVVLLSEVTEQMQALNASGLQSVYVYASRVLYLDAHLELFGVNLALIAPKWEFVKKVKITLDGTFGEEHSTDTASAGQAGRPGNPGGSGGDFLGVGSFQEKFLVISANGGEGGRGQNGAKGHDGLNNTRPSPPFDEPSCLSQVKTFSYLSDYLPAKITHYEIYNEEGCGGSGTNGGVGGAGGHGGVVTLIRKNSVRIVKGLNGASGPPGKGGPGGIGGRNGCFYEAIDENNEFLHPVTTIKCPAGNVLPSGQFGKDNYNTHGQVFPAAKKNLSVNHCIYHYIRLAREYFVKHNDPHVLSFLKELNNYGETKLEDMISDFKSIEKFDRIEYYELFEEKLNEHIRATETNVSQFPFNYLNSIVLGEMTYLKNNINYMFVDMKDYLSILERSAKSTNENTRELQAVAYFKRKVEIKFDRLKQNLELLKVKFTDGEVSFGNGTKYSSEALQEKRISCFMKITIDFIKFLLDRPSEKTNLGLNNSLNLCSTSARRDTPRPERYGTKPPNDLANAEGALLRLLPLLIERKPETRDNLIDLKDVLDVLEESDVLLEGKKKLLQALIDEMEHFIALYYFIEWEELEDSFSKSLNKLTANSNWNISTEFLKARLLDVMVAIQVKLGEDVSRQKFHSMLKANALLPPRMKTLSDMFVRVNLLRDLGDRSPFCRNHMQAVFDKNSTVGEFFSWTNAEITEKLKILFSGAEINLKSDLINRHVLDKSFLQFNSLKLDFDCTAKETICGELREALSNFKIDITHSGYSYYNWGDETHIVVSEKVTLSYSFKTRDNREPELYNAFFKKCQDGEIKLSPFTTWTIRLVPLSEDASFDKLAAFADIISLNLVGTGTYTV